MSASNSIQIRRVSVTDPKDMPTKGIAETPGGTMYGTTPGGTRIIYDRLFMLRQKQAPVSRTPPSLPQIPGITKDLSENRSKNNSLSKQEEREHGVIEETSEENGAGDNKAVKISENSTAQNQSFQDENVDEAVDDELDMEM